MRLIDADAFKEYIRGACEEMSHVYKDGDKWAKQITEDFCMDIDDQPTIEPQRWIPCSERLPEESGKYLISVLDGVGRRTTVAPYQPRYKAWTMTGRMAYWKVVAWQPLPEPYKEETE